MRHYWQISKLSVCGFLLAAPLWLLYEALTFRFNGGLGGEIRTGVDFLIKNAFEFLRTPAWFSVILPITLLAYFLAKNWGTIKSAQARPVYFGLMLLESLLYGAVLGFLVAGMSGIFLSQNPITVAQPMVNTLVVNLGSGVYEEFVFRFLLISGIALFLQKFFRIKNVVIYGCAILLSAASFAFYHYLEVFGEPFETGTFLFRFFAGVFFSFVFIYRGYGIAAYTHSFYNIFLMFR